MMLDSVRTLHGIIIKIEHIRKHNIHSINKNKRPTVRFEGNGRTRWRTPILEIILISTELTELEPEIL